MVAITFINLPNRVVFHSKGKIMKKFAIAFALVLGSQFVIADEPAKKETAKVCVDVKQNCKEVKQHRKLEGTEVPAKK
jgi:energy-coupling factor transporter ATP-binding protein EcfA2